MAETTTTGLPQLDVDAVAAAVACVGQGEDWAHTPLHSGELGSTNPPAQSKKWFFAKKPRNPAKHVALLFAQNCAPGGAEHIAGHSDLPRSLGKGSSASKAELCPRLSLLSSSVPGSGGDRFTLAANLSTPFCPSEEQGLQQQVLNLHQFLMLTNHREVPGKICCKWFYSTKVTLKNTFSSYFHVVKSPEGSLLSREMRGGGRHTNANENSCGLLSNLLALPSEVLL